MLLSTEMDTIQNIYIAFYGRPADPDGQAFWARELAEAQGDVSSIINAFANADEYHDRYGHLSTSELIQGLYQQILGREAEAAGVAFYQEEVEAGRISLGELALAILDGALGGDGDTLEKRKLAADLFTEAVSDQSLDYSGEMIDAAKTFLENISGETSPETIEQLLDTTLASVPVLTSFTFELDETEAIPTPIDSVFADYHDVDRVEISFSEDEISGTLHIPQVPAYSRQAGEYMEIWYVLTFDVNATEGNDLVLRFSLPAESHSEGGFAIYPLGNFAADSDSLEVISTLATPSTELLAFDFDAQDNRIHFELDADGLAQHLDQNDSPVFADAVTRMNVDTLSWVQAIGINLDISSEGNAINSFIYMLE